MSADTVLLLTGGALTLGGGVIGALVHAALARHRRVVHVCECAHALSYHDPATGACGHRRWSEFQSGYVRCVCVRYVGPTPPAPPPTPLDPDDVLRALRGDPPATDRGAHP